MATSVNAALQRVKKFARIGRAGDRVSPYYDDRSIATGVKRGMHRELIGGMWDEVGEWQFNLLNSEGLRPHHRLLDVGCGSFRGGVRFVEFLDAGNYFGFDLSRQLIEAGYAREIEAGGLAGKLPKQNLCVTGDFSCEVFGGGFDYAIAVSVFTHLPLNHWRVALERLAPQMKPGGLFYATYFPCPEDAAFAQDISHEGAGVVSHATSDPYHCRVFDVVHLARGLPWKADALDVRNHARGQKVLKFERAK